MKSGEGGKDCKCAVVQQGKRGQNVWLCCNTCKQFRIWFFQKCRVIGVAIGQVCSTDGVAWWSENKACSGILHCLYRFNNTVRSAHEKGIAVVWSRQYARRRRFLKSSLTNMFSVFVMTTGIKAPWDIILLSKKYCTNIIVTCRTLKGRPLKGQVQG